MSSSKISANAPEEWDSESFVSASSHFHNSTSDLERELSNKENLINIRPTVSSAQIISNSNNTRQPVGILRNAKQKQKSDHQTKILINEQPNAAYTDQIYINQNLSVNVNHTRVSNATSSHSYNRSPIPNTTNASTSKSRDLEKESSSQISSRSSWLSSTSSTLKSFKKVKNLSKLLPFSAHRKSYSNSNNYFLNFKNGNKSCGASFQETYNEQFFKNLPVTTSKDAKNNSHSQKQNSKALRLKKWTCAGEIDLNLFRPKKLPNPTLNVDEQKTCNTSNEPNPIWVVKFSNCGRLLAAAGQDGHIYVWSLDQYKNYFKDKQKLSMQDGNGQQSNGQINAETTCNPEIKIPKITTNTCNGNTATLKSPFGDSPLIIFSWHETDIYDLCWNKDNFLVSSSRTGTVCIWHIQKPNPVVIFDQKAAVMSVKFIEEDDKFLSKSFISCTQKGVIRYNDWMERKMDKLINLSVQGHYSGTEQNQHHQHQHIITAMQLYNNNKNIAIGTSTGSLLFYELKLSNSSKSLTLITETSINKSQGVRLTVSASKNTFRQNSKVCGISVFRIRGSKFDSLLVSSDDRKVRLYSGKDHCLVMTFKRKNLPVDQNIHEQNSTSQGGFSSSTDQTPIITQDNKLILISNINSQIFSIFPISSSDQGSLARDSLSVILPEQVSKFHVNVDSFVNFEDLVGSVKKKKEHDAQHNAQHMVTDSSISGNTATSNVSNVSNMSNISSNSLTQLQNSISEVELEQHHNQSSSFFEEKTTNTNTRAQTDSTKGPVAQNMHVSSTTSIQNQSSLQSSFSYYSPITAICCPPRVDFFRQYFENNGIRFDQEIGYLGLGGRFFAHTNFSKDFRNFF